MPCFHGLAVSIHTPEGPLPEYHIQKQARLHRITTYIPVPPPKVTGASDTKPEQSTFAISITLLTPGLNVPYSTPKPTLADPHPRPKIVGGLPDYTGQRGKYGGVIGPYTPITASANETIAAYIYFDGRVKEEVATLLRRGEETWVNSRWVSVPDTEGGGLAEREFIFREVGLERWLNGLDLAGNTEDVQARIKRRREKFEKKRAKKETLDDDDEIEESLTRRKQRERNGVLRYGDDKNAPVEALSDSDSLTDSDSEAEQIPEATGQIKVALFRVIASGEIKKGEYSPQFDVHDDEEEGGAGGGNTDADVDHTTSFAKPKTLDPKSISTQTVTGIDPPDKPYAVFTFFYRGERQLRKMGILQSSQPSKTPTVSKRKSANLDLGKLGPLGKSEKKISGAYRDPSERQKASKAKGRDDDAMSDSDADDDEEYDTEDLVLKQEEDMETSNNPDKLLSPEDALRSEALSEGVRKIKLKRQHSAEPLEASVSPNNQSPSASTPVSGDNAIPLSATANPDALSLDNPSAPANPKIAAPSAIPPNVTSEPNIGSPFKKQRASMSGIEDKIQMRKFSSSIESSNARRESESALHALSSPSANAGPTSAAGWQSGIQGGSVSKLELGPPLKPTGVKEEEGMEEEL